MKKIILVVFLVVLGIRFFAQGPPITTETPIMLGLGGNGIRTFGKLIVKENVSVYVHPIAIPYNITPKFQVGAIVPFKRVAINNGPSTNGLADVAFFSKYQLYKKDEKAKTFRVLARYIQRFPTAKTSETPSLGMGLYESYFGLVVGRITSKIGMYGDAGITIKEGAGSESLPYNLSVGIPLLPQQYPQKQINTFLEFNGNYVFQSQVHELFLSPGVQYIPGRRLLLETSFQYPVLQQNITENKTLYRWMLGARLLIN